MDINPIERMRLILRVRNALLQYVFGDQDKLQENVIFKIAEENQKLLGCETATFMYRKKWYPTHIRGAALTQKQRFNRILHVDYEKKMCEIMDISFKDETSIAGVESLLNKALSTAKTTEDIRNLLPADLYRVAMRVIETPDNFLESDISINSIGEKEIEQFKHHHSEDYKYLHKIIMTRLLLNQGI